MGFPHLFCAAIFGCVPVFAGDGRPVAEFTSAESVDFDWRIVDDGVMGGLSQGRHEIGSDGILRFSGMLSLENNGGFSSLRSGDLKMDLGKAEGVVMRVKGDGRSYQLRFGTDARYRGQAMFFKCGFPTVKGEWIEVKLPFKGFTGSWRGVELPGKVFDPSKIRRIGLQLADKKEGPFELRVDWIRSYGGGTPGSG
jgi:monofunctional biosynthetic peptidoglycan transglycosylase